MAKRMIKLAGILLSAVIMLSFLSGCAKNEAAQDSEETVVSGTFVPKADYDVWDEKYAPVLDCWRTAVSENFGCDLSGENYKSYTYMPEYNVLDWLTADTFYAYYDIDSDGTAELLTAAYESREDCYYVLEAYTLDGDEPVRMFADITDSGFDREVNFMNYNDGIRAMYPDFIDWWNWMRDLEWRVLAPAAVSKAAEDYLDGYTSISCPAPEYDEVIDICRKLIWVYNVISGRKYNSAVTYELLWGGDPVRFEKECPAEGIRQVLGFGSGYEYALYDINGDGTDELILAYYEEADHGEYKRYVCDIFSLCGSEPKHMLDFYPKNRCTAIDKDGHVYNDCDAGYVVYTIEPGSGSISYERIDHDYDGYTYGSCSVFDPAMEYLEDDETSDLSEEEGGQMIKRFIGENVEDNIIDSLEFVPFFM